MASIHDRCAKLKVTYDRAEYIISGQCDWTVYILTSKGVPYGVEGWGAEGRVTVGGGRGESVQ